MQYQAPRSKSNRSLLQFLYLSGMFVQEFRQPCQQKIIPLFLFWRRTNRWLRRSLLRHTHQDPMRVRVTTGGVPMNPAPQIPIPDTIPAPAWLFHVLEVSLFSLHILVINVVIGGTLMALASRFSKSANTPPFSVALSSKLPVSFALGINLGVAPLLFLQVLYGHLFYSSSILMGRFWIVIIPLAILGYYGAHIHAKSSRRILATVAIAVTTCAVLYISFMFVHNILMMMNPQVWAGYFLNRRGTMLNLSDATLIPRYLHFLVASLAVAGLASSLVWSIWEKQGREGSKGMVARGLAIFGFATIAQILVGTWLLLSQRREFLLQFMGGDLVGSICLGLGSLCGIGAIATSFAGKLRPTLVMAVITLVAMILVRDRLRSMYLQGVFETSTLQVNPQYGVLTLFLIILLVGLACVVWMLKAGFQRPSRRTAR